MERKLFGAESSGHTFVLRNGEWECLGPGAELKLGTEIRIVAEATNAPPSMYSSGSAGVNISQQGVVADVAHDLA